MAPLSHGRTLGLEMYSQASHVGPFIVVMLTLHALLVATLILFARLQTG